MVTRLRSDKGSFVRSPKGSFETSVGPEVQFTIQLPGGTLGTTADANVRDCATWVPPFFPTTSAFNIINDSAINKLSFPSWPVDIGGRAYMVTSVDQLRTPTAFIVASGLFVVNELWPYQDPLVVCLDEQTGQFYTRAADNYASALAPPFDEFQFAFFLRNTGDLLNPTHPWIADFPLGTYDLTLTGLPQASVP